MIAQWRLFMKLIDAFYVDDNFDSATAPLLVFNKYPTDGKWILLFPANNVNETEQVKLPNVT